MKRCFLGIAAAVWILILASPAAAQIDVPQKPNPLDGPRKPNPLDPYCRKVGNLVKQYYPDALILATHDKKLKADKIRIEYNIQLLIMRYRNKDGTWQEPQPVRGPYVGGIWCDLVLHKGRYKGDIEGAEEGVMQLGPDFYTYLVAPYSKRQDQHMLIKLRYPGGTPPEFLEHFYAMARDFAEYMGKPEKE